MVVPSRIADVGARFGKPAVQEIRPDFERARAAQSLYGNDASLRERGLPLPNNKCCTALR